MANETTGCAGFMDLQNQQQGKVRCRFLCPRKDNECPLGTRKKDDQGRRIIEEEYIGASTPDGLSPRDTERAREEFQGPARRMCNTKRWTAQAKNGK